MKKANDAPRKCPLCGNEYTARPALSRIDGATLICPDCGSRQALESLGVSTEEQEKILDIMHRYAEQTGG